MSKETRDPSEVITEDRKSSRRDLLKRALIGLGASVILQPNGGVLGLSFGDEPKKEPKIKLSTIKLSTIHKKGGGEPKNKPQIKLSTIKSSTIHKKGGGEPKNKPQIKLSTIKSSTIHKKGGEEPKKE